MSRKAKWVQYTDSCTGCFESMDGQPCGEYPVDPKHNCYIGAGCHECGYTGKRRHRYLISDLIPDREHNAGCSCIACISHENEYPGGVL